MLTPALPSLVQISSPISSVSSHSLSLLFPCRQLLFAIANPILVVCQIPNSFALSLPVTSFTINSSSCKNKFNSKSLQTAEQTNNKQANRHVWATGKEWEREREVVAKKKKNCRWKKSQNWHLNFYWRFAVCSPNKLTAAKGPSTPNPLCPLRQSTVNHRASTKAVQTARKPVLDSAAHKCWWMLILLLLLLGKQAPHESVGEIYSWVELFFMARRAAGGVACFAIDLILNCAQYV